MNEIEPKKKVGRKLILNDKKITELVLYISAGNYEVVACAAAGIGQSTFYYWLKKGEEETEKYEKAMIEYEEEFYRLVGLDKPTDKLKEPEKSIYIEFLERIKAAQAIKEIRLVKKIDDDPSWQSAAWKLERKWFERWGRKDFVDHNVSGNITLVASNEFKPDVKGVNKKIEDKEDENNN